MLGEEDRLYRRSATRTGLSLVLVDAQRLRRFVGELAVRGDRLLVVVDRVAEHVQGRQQPLDLLAVQVRALLEGGEARLPEDLVDPGAADPGDVALVAEQRVQMTGLVDQLGEALEWRRRPGLRSEPGDRLVLVDRRGRQQLRPGPLL